MKNIAFYLPQFHEEALNEGVWGREFTDWTTSQNARRLYPGHKQPKKPNFPRYNLDDAGLTLKQQVEQAKNIGLDGFSYYFYSFAPHLNALRKPLNGFLSSDIDFPFLITWANHSWTKAWVGDHDTVIAKQRFDNKQVKYFSEELAPFLVDSRYIHHDGRPVICVLNAKKLDLAFLKKAISNEYYKLRGVRVDPFLVVPYVDGGRDSEIDLYIGWPPGDVGLAGMQSFSKLRRIIRHLAKGRGGAKAFKSLNIGQEDRFLKSQLKAAKKLSMLSFSQTLLTGWDNTPRYGSRGYEIAQNDKGEYCDLTLDILKQNRRNKVPFTFIKAWNEWAEGNVMEEPVDGVNYGQLIKKVLGDLSRDCK